MAVEWFVVGAPTASGVTVKAKVDTTSARLAVSSAATLSDPVWFGPVSADTWGIVTFEVDNLGADEHWHYAIESGGALDVRRGRFWTAPAVGQPASFTFACAGDGGLTPEAPGVGDLLAPERQSNHEIYRLIRDRALAEEWRFFLHLGDMHYYDIGQDRHGIDPTGHLETYMRAYDDTISQPNQMRLYRNVATGYVWDDHDYGPNNGDKTSPGRDNACRAYRLAWPHHPLVETDDVGSIYHAWQYGRVLFVMADTRSERDPNTDEDTPAKGMLGTAQVDWMEALLADPPSGAEMLVWVMSKPWPSTIGGGGDSWGRFGHERERILKIFRDTGWTDRMCVISADMHAVGMDDGAIINRIGPHFGNYPNYVFASLDARAGSPGQAWNLRPTSPGRRRYGTISVDDVGWRIDVEVTAWAERWPLAVHRWTVDIADPPAVDGTQDGTQTVFATVTIGAS